MKATQMLMDEHRVIERVLAALESATDKLEEGGGVRPGFFSEAAEFMKEFADGCHHKKEEDVLFKVMVENGLPSDEGPIGVMKSEHVQGRTYTKAIRESAEKFGSGNDSARDALIANSRGYAALLREHIAKEDHILFPMADRVIPTARHDEILNDFRRVEHDEVGAGVHDQYLALAEKLEREANTP